ncbi:DUF4232 domain-containing protein [Nonomuraea sp. NPDC049695]|uniref:DUF4232 domain-containing protein n=1 Tax=Nonomuraea sp. NPDC049695 TaxID=3154734 RepID=UPI003423E040
MKADRRRTAAVTAMLLLAVTGWGAEAHATSSSETAAQRCVTGQLKASLGRIDPGAGQRNTDLLLTNRSARTCSVYGFVGLIMIDGKGDALRTRVRRNGVTPHRVTLKPGHSAKAGLHWGVIETGGEKTCPTAARLMIIPPDETAHLEIPFNAQVCDDGRIDVAPLR